MREKGITAREIARLLSISVREVYRLLRNVVTSVVRVVQSASKTTVQGPPALSDFKGARGPVSLVLGDVGVGKVNSTDMIVNDDFVISEPLPRSEERLPQQSSPSTRSPRVARNSRAMRRATEGGFGETNVGESPIAYIQRRVREIVAKQRAGAATIDRRVRFVYDRDDAGDFDHGDVERNALRRFSARVSRC